MPAAAAGNSKRTARLSTTTRPRLVVQRRALETLGARNGRAISHSAIAAKTPKKAPQRGSGSCARIQLDAFIPGLLLRP